MHLTPRRRRRFTQEQIDQILEDYYHSGATQTDFATERGIGLSTLCRWLSRSVGKTKRPTPAEVVPTWLEVAAVPASVCPAARSYRVDLPGGISVRVEGGFDAAEVQQLLRVLR